MPLIGCFNPICDAVFCAGGPNESPTSNSSWAIDTHTFGHTFPYQTACCGNCHDLIAFLILHLITHFTEETFFLLPTTARPVREPTLSKEASIL